MTHPSHPAMPVRVTIPALNATKNRLLVARIRRRDVPVDSHDSTRPRSSSRLTAPHALMRPQAAKTSAKNP
jgi:hypothetical protein